MTVSLPELERLLAEATERPWRTDRRFPRCVLGRIRSVAVCERIRRGRTDATLIAEAVNALPALIAAVKALVDLRYAPPSQETDASRSAAIALAAFSFEADA